MSEQATPAWASRLADDIRCDIKELRTDVAVIQKDLAVNTQQTIHIHKCIHRVEDTANRLATKVEGAPEDKDGGMAGRLRDARKRVGGLEEREKGRKKWLIGTATAAGLSFVGAAIAVGLEILKEKIAGK